MQLCYMFLNMSINSQIFIVSLKFSFKTNTTAAINETSHPNNFQSSKHLNEPPSSWRLGTGWRG